MSKDELLIQHVRDAIKRIEEYTAGLDEAKFTENLVVRDAVLRQLEIIGEAARTLSEDGKKKYPSVNWYQIVGMRNRLIHEYFDVSWKVVWQTVANDLPKLKKHLSGS